MALASSCCHAFPVRLARTASLPMQAEWRGAHVAVKLVVSDNAEKLQDSVMEAITGRFLAHPQVRPQHQQGCFL